MSRKFSFVAVLICAALLSAGTFVAQAQGMTSRRNQTCAEDSTWLPYGFYWDGQKCEQCSDAQAYCGTAAAAKFCNTAYTPVLVANQASMFPNGTCQLCAYQLTFGESAQLTSSPIVYDATINMWNVNTKIVTKCQNASAVNTPWNSDAVATYRNSLRATKCLDSTASQGYMLFGSVCWYQTGCLTYNAFGRCTSCADTYFLNEMQFCKLCPLSRYTTDKVEFTDYITPLATGIFSDIRCLKCSNENVCLTCPIGSYLANVTQYPATAFTDTKYNNTLEQASWCKPCPAGCKCSGFTLNSTSNMVFADLAPMDNTYFLIAGEQKCYPCNKEEKGGIKMCTTCTMGTSLTCLTCSTTALTSATTSTSTSGATQYYARNTTTIRGRICENACPDGCTNCTILSTTADAATTTCVDKYCANGFRQTIDKTTASQITCTMCKKDGVLRCESSNTTATSEEVPTQCRQGRIAGTDDEARLAQNVKFQPWNWQNSNPANVIEIFPNPTDQFLIRLNASDPQSKLTCVKNSYYCRTMKNGSTTGSCETCYTQFGWQPINVTDASNVTTTKCSNCPYSSAATPAASQRLNCVKCQQNSASADSLKCIECADGFAFDATIDSANPGCTVSCSAKILGCTSCTRSVSGDSVVSYACKENGCMTGYRYNAGVCEKCTLDKCGQCKAIDVNWCDSCIEGNYLWQSANKGVWLAGQTNIYQQCQACDTGCLDCSNNRKVCSRCQTTDANGVPKYFLNNGVCQVVQPNCAQMNLVASSEPWACQVCNYGYRLLDGRCMQCFDPFRGYVHCPQTTDTSGFLWYTNVDTVAWQQAADRYTNRINGSTFGAAPLSFCLLAALALLALLF